MIKKYKRGGEVSPCAHTSLWATPSAGALPPQRPRWGVQDPPDPPAKKLTFSG
jgi:hypothetical protein